MRTPKPNVFNEDDPYSILGVSPSATQVELKAAYRNLAKKYHPDAGGDEKSILELNAAWELVGDIDKRTAYDNQRQHSKSLADQSKQRSVRDSNASSVASRVKDRSAACKADIDSWILKVYIPINKLLGQVIAPYSRELSALSADPYDDLLMEAFVLYLEKSRRRMDKVNQIYRSIPVPLFAEELGLSLYHCLSQVDDGLSEFERYTMGYVDNYLHDGREMLREAKKLRSNLNEKRRRLESL